MKSQDIPQRFNFFSLGLISFQFFLKMQVVLFLKIVVVSCLNT